LPSFLPEVWKEKKKYPLWNSEVSNPRQVTYTKAIVETKRCHFVTYALSPHGIVKNA
jgi:hypothetical protein